MGIRWRRSMRGLVVLAACAAVVSACSVEPIDDPGLGELGLTSIVYAADGSVLAQWHAEEDRVLVAFDEVADVLHEAVVAIEDERFWTHPGVDVEAVARALLANLEAGDVVQGASTITQQYIKNVVLTPEVTVDRKLTEAALALRLEEGLSKEEILERYLNTVYFGDGAYGAGAAAAHYFDKGVDQLTLAEAALLAGLIQSPATTDPYRYPEAALERRRVVLTKMAELGLVGEDEARTADAVPLELAPARATGADRYPYFTEEVKRYLLDQPILGATATDRYNALFRGGLRIYTTLDPLLQESAHQALGTVLPDDGPSGAIVAVEPRTGYVRALVGGRDFYDPDDPVAQFNLGTQGQRQPGSSFKPFTLAAALERGVPLDQMLTGGQTVTIDTDSGPWNVENYNGTVFPDLTMLEATVFSVNVAYARLVDSVGPDLVMDIAEAAGITSDLQPYHAITLGAQEVTVLEMASAYGTFAADGVHVEPVLVTHIDDAEGINVWSSIPVVTEAISRDVALEVTAALTEVVRRGTGQQAKIGRPVAGKTGSSQEHRDAWFVGYTPELSAAVWVGFADQPASMEPPTTPYTITGGTWPAQIWSRFAAAALSGTAPGQLATADSSGQVSVEVDLSTGFLAGPFCPRQHVHRVQMPADAVPTVVCPIHNPTNVVTAGAREVPSVIGLDLGSAVSELTTYGYQTRVEYAPGGNLARGTVFDQLPSPGFPAQNGTTITLTVAGPRPGSVVDSVLGFPVGQAEARLAQLGVTVRVIVEAEANPEDARRRTGVVWKQDPAPDLPISGVVTLWANP